MAATGTEIFGIEEIHLGPAATLRLHGELDLVTAHSLGEAVERALRGRPRMLTIDLSSLRFMDSSGVHAVTAAERLCATQDVRFHLIGKPGAINRLLAMCGLEGRPRHSGSARRSIVRRPN